MSDLSNWLAPLCVVTVQLYYINATDGGTPKLRISFAVFWKLTSYFINFKVEQMHIISWSFQRIFDAQRGMFAEALKNWQGVVFSFQDKVWRELRNVANNRDTCFAIFTVDMQYNHNRLSSGLVILYIFHNLTDLLNFLMERNLLHFRWRTCLLFQFGSVRFLSVRLSYTKVKFKRANTLNGLNKI